MAEYNVFETVSEMYPPEGADFTENTRVYFDGIEKGCDMVEAHFEKKVDGVLVDTSFMIVEKEDLERLIVKFKEIISIMK